MVVENIVCIFNCDSVDTLFITTAIVPSNPLHSNNTQSLNYNFSNHNYVPNHSADNHGKKGQDIAAVVLDLHQAADWAARLGADPGSLGIVLNLVFDSKPAPRAAHPDPPAAATHGILTG